MNDNKVQVSPTIDREKDPVFRLYKEHDQERMELARSYTMAANAHREARDAVASGESNDAINELRDLMLFARDQYLDADARCKVVYHVWKCHHRYLVRLMRELGLENVPDLP